MKQYLGRRKQARIERFLGGPICAALTRGGWEHGVAEVWLTRQDAIYVDYRRLVIIGICAIDGYPRGRVA